MPAQPVSANERVSLIDVLRGFALCGVFVSNAYLHFSCRYLLPRADIEALVSWWPNAVADFLFERLVSEKAMSIFSFLFGLGFAIQLGRAEERGASFAPLYCRRLGVLLAIGLTHLFALWYGDVLSLYATAGFALLLFRKLPDRRLIAWGLALLLVGPIAFTAAQRLVPLLASSEEVVQAAGKEMGAFVAEIKRQTLAGFTSGSYLVMARANFDYFFALWLSPMTAAYGIYSLGRFLLGYVAGRRRLFHDASRHLPFFRRLLLWGLGVGLLGNGVGMLFRYHVIPLEAPALKRAWSVLQPSVWETGVLGLAAFYVAGVTLLFQRSRPRRLLSVLAPAGQMALTNYLTQTVLSELVFYGYGFNLGGKLGAVSCLSLMFGLFWVQVLWSHLWLARFRFGPAEWLWRSLTYGKLQPMRRELAQAAEAAASV